MSRKNRKVRRAAYVQPIDTTITTAINTETSLANNGTDKNGAWVFRQLSSAILETDASYQRPIDAKRVEHIVANYDWRLVNALKVSHRDGHYYVFDGAHTLAVLKKIHDSNPFDVVCKVFSGLTFEDEAYLFSLQNGESKDVAFKARLNAMLLSNSKEAIAFRTRTKNAGFTLREAKANGMSASSGKYTIACLAKAYKLFTEMGGDDYERLLSLLAATWGGANWSVTQYVMGGTATLMRIYGGELNTERFIRKLANTDYNKLRGEADGQSSKSSDVSHAIALGKQYNRGGGKGTLNLARLTVLE